MKKNIIFLVFMLIPSIVFASSILSYDRSLDSINHKITNFYKYSDYLITDNRNYKCALLNGQIKCSEKDPFSLSGYLNLDEYIIIGGLNSYLNDGIPYYTMTTSEDNVTLIVGGHINESGYKSVSGLESLGYIRITQYINNKVNITGTGTYVDPWVFDTEKIPIEWMNDPDIAFGIPLGTSGDNDWYKSDITVNTVTQMPEGAIEEFKYCLTSTEESCIPNVNITGTSEKIIISTESENNIICANIKTVVGKENSVCSSDSNKYGTPYKIDKTAPTCKVSASGNNFAVTDVVETLSKLPTEAYSWISSSAGFGSATTTASTDALEYNAWVKDNASNVGLCSKITCSAWSAPVTATTTSTCDDSIAATVKISECTTLYTCSKAATVSYSCPHGSLVSGTDYCNGSISKSQSGCDTQIVKGSTTKGVSSSSACSSKCGGSRLTCSNCGGTWSHYYFYTKSGVNYCECRKKCAGTIKYSYSCSSGGSNQGNSWCKYNANKSYSCASGYSLSSTTCSKDDQASCASGDTATATTKKQYLTSTRTCSD